MKATGHQTEFKQHVLWTEQWAEKDENSVCEWTSFGTE